MHYVYEPFILRRLAENRIFVCSPKIPFEYTICCFQSEKPFFMVSQFEDGRVAVPEVVDRLALDPERHAAVIRGAPAVEQPRSIGVQTPQVDAAEDYGRVDPLRPCAGVDDDRAQERAGVDAQDVAVRAEPVLAEQQVTIAGAVGRQPREDRLERLAVAGVPIDEGVEGA